MMVQKNARINGAVTGNRLNAALERLAQKNEKALAVFLMGGDPDPASCEELLQAAVEGGADIVEIGIPFSDPLADGPVIQNAAGRALAAGVTPSAVLELVRGLRRRSAVPIALLVYYNTVFHYGHHRFAASAAQCGADALIVPDLPFEEKDPLEEACRAHGLVLIRILAPGGSRARIQQIAADADGFLYCVSRPGVTGVREGLYEGLRDFIGEVRRSSTTRPLLVGFGISTPQQAQQAASLADGVIVGSALVQEVEKGSASPPDASPTAELRQIIREHVCSFKRALLASPW